jgi:4-oxalocrotonate tautomerase
MPHVIVKMYPGRSEQQKAQLAEAITALARVGADAVSVAIKEITAKDPSRSISHTSLGMPTSYTKLYWTNRWLSSTYLGQAL